MDLLSDLNNTTITIQIQKLCRELCRIHSLPFPDEIQNLVDPELPEDVEFKEPDSDSDIDFIAEDDIDMEIQADKKFKKDYESGTVEDEADIEAENKKTLDKWVNQQAQNNLKVINFERK